MVLYVVFVCCSCHRVLCCVVWCSDVWFSDRQLSNARLLRKVTCLHVLNHIFKTKHLILKNNAKLKNAADKEKRDSRVDLNALAAAHAQKEKGKKKHRPKRPLNPANFVPPPSAVAAATAAAAAASAASDGDEYRDQGFTRPKVLIVLPFRNSAYEYVRQLLSLLPDAQKKTVMNKKRFREEFGLPPDYQVLPLSLLFPL